MLPWSSAPPDVLRAVLGFWPLPWRLAAEVLSRRWLEVAASASLWEDVEVPPELIGRLPALLWRHGHAMKRLTVIFRPGQPSVLTSAFSCCVQLTHLHLRSLRALRAETSNADDATTRKSTASEALGDTVEMPAATAEVLRVPSLRSLVLEHLPYFVLHWFSHHTGSSVATVQAHWLAQIFPALEDLTCDYLLVCREGSGLARLPSLRRLAFAAVVADGGKTGSSRSWNTAGCSCDLKAVAQAAPDLEMLQVRSPRFNSSRMSCGPGQSVEDMPLVCRWFCAVCLADLRGVGSLFPSLRRLDVDMLRDLDDQEREAVEADGLADFLGLLPQGTQQVKRPPLLVRVSGATAAFSSVRAAAAKCTEHVTLEVLQELSV